MQKRFAVICGAFNPVTKAHLNMAKLVLKEKIADSVIFVPSKDNYIKNIQLKDLHDKNTNLFTNNGSTRVLWLRKAIKSNEHLKNNTHVDCFELNKEEQPKTYETLSHIKEKYNNTCVYLCIGSDKLTELFEWYRIEDLLQSFKIIVIERNNDRAEEIIDNDTLLKTYKERFIILKNDKYENVSSSDIRNKVNQIIKLQKEIKQNVPNSVYKTLF